MSLKATCEMKEGILEELMQDGDGLSGMDSAANLAWVEWQESVDALYTAIKQLTQQINRECSHLNKKDSSHSGLQKTENDKWVMGFANLHVLRTSCFINFKLGSLN